MPDVDPIVSEALSKLPWPGYSPYMTVKQARELLWKLYNGAAEALHVLEDHLNETARTDG